MKTVFLVLDSGNSPGRLYGIFTSMRGAMAAAQKADEEHGCPANDYEATVIEQVQVNQLWSDGL